MFVFRDGKRPLDAGERLHALEHAAQRRDALDVLLRAGELESALDDAGDPAAAQLARWADRAADALVTGGRLELPPEPPCACPRTLTLRASVPEGFAYYALHPIDYAHAAREAVPDDPRRAVLVVGLRTIGAPLSAVAAAALRARGHEVHRATVRPLGPAFDRRVELSAPLVARARDVASRGGAALLADEGPGLSGSSFLATADALVRAGFPRDRIVLLPSHDPEPERLRAPDAASRWSALRRVVARPTRAVPEDARIELSAGAWRRLLLARGSDPPATWPAMERRKYLASDGSLLRFEGLGHHGAAPRARGEVLAQLGIGPALRPERDGFVRWERAPGRPLASTDAPPLDALARAIAARLELAAPEEDALDLAALEDATRANVHALLEQDLPASFSLPLARPAIVDGRLAPHEWIADARGGLRKVDATSHGDDHFLPGPCDVAWDLAGAVVEWRLDEAHTGALLDRHARRTGDGDARARLAPWLVAYAAFRAAWLAMARDACAGTPEHARLADAAARARARLSVSLPL